MPIAHAVQGKNIKNVVGCRNKRSLLNCQICAEH